MFKSYVMLIRMTFIGNYTLKELDLLVFST